MYGTVDQEGRVYLKVCDGRHGRIDIHNIVYHNIKGRQGDRVSLSHLFDNVSSLKLTYGK